MLGPAAASSRCSSSQQQVHAGAQHPSSTATHVRETLDSSLRRRDTCTLSCCTSAAASAAGPSSPEAAASVWRSCALARAARFASSSRATAGSDRTATPRLDEKSQAGLPESCRNTRAIPPSPPNPHARALTRAQALAQRAALVAHGIDAV